MHAGHYIGVLSGTSLDGLDIVLTTITNSGNVQQTDALNWPLPADLQQRCALLCTPGNNEIVHFGIADRQFALAAVAGIQELLSRNQLQASDIQAIGSHGQTIRHHPELTPAFSIQLGCPHTIAALSGIDVVGQFRQKDIALGGEGAPLAPALHQQLFASRERYRVIANIGGIANITALPPHQVADESAATKVIGFDSGPGNTLMDHWVQKHLHTPFDRNGEWAAQGTADGPLLAELLSDPYFHRQAPKSTGREYFTANWLAKALQRRSQIAPENVQATLLELTARSLTDAIIQLDGLATQHEVEVYVCGGGAQNKQLLKRCQELTNASNAPTKMAWHTTEALGVHPDWVEGVLFAWLAWAHCAGKQINLSSVTGASRPAILGGYFPAN